MAVLFTTATCNISLSSSVTNVLCNGGSTGSIDLTAEEYNQYITFINMRDPDTGLDMLGEMRKIILDPEFKAHSKKGEQLDALKRVLAVRKTNAAKMMKAKYKHLAAAIKALDERIALTGKK